NIQHIYSFKKSTTETHPTNKELSENNIVEISKHKNTHLRAQISVPESGLYAIDFWYANGEGPISTSNKCAIRTLKIENKFTGTVVFPQRGADDWSNWGFTNSIQVKLEKGSFNLVLTFEPANENMNGEVNRALLDFIRVIKIAA
ncbi:MAG: glycogen debranching protein, partial [Bacteroidota bacterium]|nr:glycogen debranching protein [Bacteroidota bacterium]